MNSNQVEPNSVCPYHCPVHTAKGCGTASRGGDACVCYTGGRTCKHEPCLSQHFCGIYIYDDKDLI